MNQRLVGKTVKSLREQRGLTIVQLAEKSGLSHQTVRNLEYGRFAPAVETLESLARALGVELGALISPARARA